jgi:hypothetical protein
VSMKMAQTINIIANKLKFFRSTLFDQAFAHFVKRQRKGYRGEDGEVADSRQQPGVDPAVREGPGEVDQMGKREKLRRCLRPSGQVLHGEEGSAEEEHRRDEEKDRQVEDFDVRDQ